MFEIIKYSIEHEDGLLDLLKKEPDWSDYTATDFIETFRRSLMEGETIICKNGQECCGYLRAVNDGLGLYISELYVAPSWRNRGIGRRLVEEFKQQNIDRDVYLLSDEDAYYEMLGYRKVGSVFKIGLQGDAST